MPMKLLIKLVYFYLFLIQYYHPGGTVRIEVQKKVFFSLNLRLTPGRYNHYLYPPGCSFWLFTES
jgi:hypothetical protein